MQGHTGWITAVCHFPQSNLTISGARDRTLKIWDISSGELRQTIPLLGEPPTWLRISPDERLVAIASGQSNQSVKILDLETGRFTGNPLAHEGTLTSIAFSPDSSQILAVEQRGIARLWNSRESEAVKEGLTRTVGVSNFNPNQTLRAYATLRPADDKEDQIIAGIDKLWAGFGVQR